jgi:vesicle-associated membrane protein 72
MTNLCRPRLKEHMEYCAEHPEELDKMAKIKSQVAEVKGVMMDNIEQVLDRGGKIEDLVEKSDTLRNQVGFTTSHNHI